jgi:Tol biopolymer transport system component/DNA-binding winged helix-turn-helix (wHTH) protein
MDNGDRPAQLVRFGIFEADLQTGELRKNGVKVPLQGQPFQVCAILLKHSGELVTRDELRKKVWPEDTFVDFDHGLNTAITKIRTALGDEADNPRFVETLPRRGYRFIAAVDKPPPSASLPAAPKRSFAGLRANKNWFIASTALLILLCGLGLRRYSRNHAAAPMPAIEVVPLTGLSGNEIQPAFSPDGNQVAFVIREGGGTENRGIYTRMVDGGKALRLTNNPGDFSPTWSPDGRRVAFYRYDGGLAIYAVPALGGTEDRLYTGSPSPWTEGLDWSPDGSSLAFSQGREGENRTRISLLSLSDSKIRPITSPTGQELDYCPAFSPDGSSVVFVRGTLAGVVSDLYVVPTAGGDARRLTFDKTWIKGAPTWTRDGREVVFASARGGLASLWRVPASGGEPQPVAGVGVIASSPSVSPIGNQLVYQQQFFKENIWRLNLKDETHRQGQPAVVGLKKGRNWRPHFSPDGKRFAFESSSSGYAEIWTCDSDGSNCLQSTSLHGTAGAPRWSPDGRFIAFEFRPKERTEIYLQEVGGGMPQLLSTLPRADNGGPSWSRDGKWIYFYSDHGGGPFQLWKVAAKGGPPIQITSNGGLFAAESADGTSLYYSKFDTPGVWKMPLRGGEEKRVWDEGGGSEWYNWALARNGIYFLQHQGNRAAVNFLDFATGKMTAVLISDRAPGIGLALSDDGKSILYDENELEDSSIMLVKNFR